MDKIETKEKLEKEVESHDELDYKSVLLKQPHLSMQSYETLDKDISPLTFEIMSRQATINIGN